MAIGLIWAGGLSKEEVIAKSAGLDILAHSTATTGRRRGERERQREREDWNGRRSRERKWKSSDVNLLRDPLSSCPSSNGDWCTHTYLRWPARTNISKCTEIPLPEFCFVSFPVNILQPSKLLSLQNVIYCPSSGYCLTADLEYISTHIWKKNFEALPKTFGRIIQRAINTIGIFGSLIWLIEGQWPNWRWMDRIPGRYQEGLHFSFTQTFAWDDNFLKSLKRHLFSALWRKEYVVSMESCGGVSELYYKL